MPMIETKVCPGCKGTKMIEATPEQFAAWHQPRGERPLVQQIFPHLTVDDREMLITGWCGPCWDKEFGDPDDKE